MRIPAERPGGEVPDLDAPVLDVVVPVYQEEYTVAACVRRLHAYLSDTFPYPFWVTIADNASTDGTAAVADRLATELPGVRVVRIPEKGRGRALKAVWSQSPASVLAYLDVDLSTDLAALGPLVAPLLSGHSDLAIGSRLHRDSRVVRGRRREVISRCYNRLLRVGLGARFSDAQCGFKAIRRDVARELLPLVDDPAWFFDTELLVLAQRCGLRIHEVPVDWYDDPDSRVDVLSTALDDLAGMWRMRREARLLRPVVDDIRRRIGRRPVTASTAVQTGRFAVVGGATTVLHLALFTVLVLATWPTQLANLTALVIAAVVNTTANRWWTFQVRGPGMWRHQAQGLAILALTWAATASALGLLAITWPHAPAVVSTLAVGAATLACTVLKFWVMRLWSPGAEACVTEEPTSEPAPEGPDWVADERRQLSWT